MKKNELLKKRAMLIACAATGWVAGHVVASSPTPPVLPTAPVMPAFQEMTSGATTTGSETWSSPFGPPTNTYSQTPPTYGAGGYSTIKEFSLSPIPAGSAGNAFSPWQNSSSDIVWQVTQAHQLPPPYYYPFGYDSTTTSVAEPSPVAPSAVVDQFVVAPNQDPIEITQAVTVENNNAGYIDGGSGYIPANGGSNNLLGLFLVGDGGYSWLRITSSGSLNTTGTAGAGHQFFSGNDSGGGVFIGAAMVNPAVTQDASSDGATGNGGYTYLDLGGPASGYGIVNVDGGTWNDSNSPVNIGYGSQGFVTVQKSGRLNAANEALILGEDSAGLSTTSTFNVPPPLHLAAGIGTMVVKSGGSLTLTGTGGYIALGRSVSSSGATGNLYITGTGSTASVSQGILVGDGGYGFLAVLSGGQVTSGGSYAAGGAKSYGVTSQPGSANIVIDGVSSSWTISGNADFGETGVATATVQNYGNLNISGTLTLGDQSTGSGTLTVQADGTIQSGAATLGNQAGATGFANVGNINTLWTVDGDLTVGNSGQGTLTLSNNGEVITTGDGILGSQTGSTGTATITDAGTEWQINGELKVGDKGDGTMSVENGGLVSVAGNVAIADSGGTSTLTLDGNGSRLIASGTSVTIGGKGDGTLIVQNAADAVVAGAGVSLGEQSTGTGTLTVQGSNTVMSAGSLTIGGYGTGTLNVQDSASLSTGTNISLGEQASGTGTATIDSAAVNDAGSLTVGGYGNGTMTIQDGGSLTVQGNDVTLGEQNTGSGTLNLSGNGSTLTFNGDMTVGKSGSGTFAVSGGADFNGSAMTLASGSGFGGASTGGTGELDINGTSLVLLSQDLTIGKYGVGTLAMASGAVLANKGDATLGSQPGTEGSATISSGSNWTVGGSLTDGSEGTGSITVQGGSSLIANGDSLTVGKQGEGSLTVTDTSSSVQYAGDLIIGKQSSGTFSIDAGAVTKPTSSGTGEVYIAETSGINGTLNIDGSGSSLSGTDMVVGGTGSQAGGTGLVSLTNGGQMNLTGKLAMWKDGTINTAGGAITLGTAGSTSPANGNVYINSQGELSGTGTITGNVTNSGGTLNIGGTQPGNLNITGNFTQSSGTFKVAIGGTGTGQASQLDATGSVSFTGGTVEFDFVNHYAPQKGQTFQFIDPPQSVSVNNVSYTFTGLAPGFEFSVTPDTNGLLFTALNNAVATPEPADMRLMLAGSIPFLLVRRKRRKLTL